MAASTEVVARVGIASPWARLGLRWNPFGEPPPEDVAGLIVLPEIDAWEAWLRRPRSVAHFLGHQGRGKTARLRRLGESFPATPYVYLASDEPLPPIRPLDRPAAEGPVLLLDEAQRLPARKRRRLFRHVAEERASLVVASHEDHGAEMESAGLAVRTETVEDLDAPRLRRILERRLEWARREPGPLPSWPPEEELLARFGDDLRSLLDHLYEIFQRRVERGRGESGRGERTSAEETEDGEM